MKMRFISILGFVFLTACGGLFWQSSAPYKTNTRLAQPGTYVAVPGDTVSAIADRTNSSVLTIIELNRLEAPFLVYPGQVLKINEQVAGAAPGAPVTVKPLPPSTSSSSTTGKPPVKSATANTGLVSEGFKPVVKPFDPTSLPPPKAEQTTVVSKSKATPTAPAAPNVPPTASPAVAPNPASAIQGADVAAPAVAPQTGASKVEVPQNPTVAPEPTTVVKTENPQKAASAPEVLKEQGTPSTTPDVKETSGFSWPLRGQLIGKFGQDGQGIKNDGINIAAPLGTPVKASAAGTVAYAGNELRGFGNLVLIRHADGWITAYAHNSELLVKKGDTIKKGQDIAKVGQSGSVTSPQLHFEIRMGAQAIDPVSKLGT